jgi:hypothetical protein
MVVNVITDPRATEKHVALLKSATTPEEWLDAEDIVRNSREAAATLQ